MSVPKFKYEDLFTRLKISDSCPHGDEIGEDWTAFRFALDPIEHELNFLPNILYDERRPAPRRVNDKADATFLCGRCALSLFDNPTSAFAVFKSIASPQRSLLGYTHLAKGKVPAKSGIAKPGKKGHVNYFEYHGVDLKESFSIDCPLTEDDGKA